MTAWMEMLKQWSLLPPTDFPLRLSPDTHIVCNKNWRQDLLYIILCLYYQFANAQELSNSDSESAVVYQPI